MRDSFGRRPSYLRVSLTPECQLGCVYCRQEGRCEPAREVLSTQELMRLVEELVDAGSLEKIRLTGGEPLLHPDVVEIAALAKRLPGVCYVGLTTNGLLLSRLAPELRRAGVDGVNISLDSLRPAVYRRLTRGGSLAKAMAGLEEARRHDWRVKINTVLLRGENDDEVLEFVRFVENTPVELRFIEVMPIGAAGQSLRPRLVPSAEVRATLERAYRLDPLPDVPTASARMFRAQRNGHTAVVGLISSVTHRFCAHCSRLRLTADGALVTCLGANGALDLKPYVRPRWRQEALREAVAQAVAAKRWGYEALGATEMHWLGG